MVLFEMRSKSTTAPSDKCRSNGITCTARVRDRKWLMSWSMSIVACPGCAPEITTTEFAANCS